MACFLATGIVACAPDVQVHAASVPAADFAQYRTYSFGVPEAAPVGYALTARSVEVERRLQPLIAAALEQKGYVASAGREGDMVVRFASGARERVVKRLSRMATAAGESAHHDYVEGDIVVDVFDGASRSQVFHGSASAEVDSVAIDDQLLGRAVRDMLATFPEERAVPISARIAGSVTP